VSEEEYALLKKIVQHHIPSENIDLSLLRNFASQLDVIGSLSPSVRPISVLNTTQQFMIESEDTLHVLQAPSVVQEKLVTEDIKNLHADLGCMMVDSSGEYSRCPTPTR
jgi:hypothetical protein